MRSAVGFFSQYAVWIRRKPTIGKKHSLNAFAQLFIG
jgi:hypothetical protein